MRTFALLMILLTISSFGLARELYPPMERPLSAIVEDGEARAVIVVRESAAQAAAEELCAYIEKISGVRLAVVPDQSVPGYKILVGSGEALSLAKSCGIAVEDSVWESLGEEDYLIKASEKGLLLCGKTELSIHYAVSAFLEKYLGVRWFMDCELGEVVPQSKTVQVGVIEDVGRPAFRLRWVGRGEWARRNGMNVAVNAAGELNMKWFVHTFTRLLPPEKYYAAHPEYFALIQGQRATKRDPRDQVQICTSTPDVVKEVAANVVKLKDEDPEIDIASVDPMDTQRFCQCENCEALDEEGVERSRAYARRLVLFYNAVAELVSKSYPGLKIKSIAYHSYAAPPLEKSLQVNDGVVIQLCHFMCHNHFFDDPNCEYNAKFHDYLLGWKKIARSVALYEYYYKVSWVQLPWPIIHVLRHDIPYLHELGCFGIATQYCENFAPNGLAYYVAAKLLWDPALNVDALVKDFCYKLYREAADPMYDYYAKLEESAIQSGVHLARQRPYAEIVRLFTPQVLSELDACITQAEKVAKDADVRGRIAMVRANLEYAKVCSEYLRKLDAVRRGTNAPWRPPEAPEQIEQIGRDYVERLREILKAGHKLKAMSWRPGSGYIECLLDPHLVVRSWDNPEYGFAGPQKFRQKINWIRDTGRKAGKAGLLPEKISLWFYGNDLDSNPEEYEHEVLIVDGKGNRKRIGVLAPPGDPGNIVDKGFAVSDLPSSVICDGKIKLIVTNPPGNWTSSTLYAVYVVPADGALTSEEVSQRIVQQTDSVRGQAMGFVEMFPSGTRISDGEELEIEIDVLP